MRRSLKNLIAAASLVSATALMGAASVAPEVSLNDLKNIVASKSATIIDANSAETYDKGHIPGAVNFAKNEKNFASILPKDKNAPIVAYCGGPMCTAWEDPAKKAKELGYTNIKHFKGGIKGWKDSGQEMAKATGKT
jgi:rhodanese-related sulfurtransferase